MLKTYLQEKDLLPILTMDDGSGVTAACWQERREEMLNALEKYSYGHTPDAPKLTTGLVQQTDEYAYAGKILQQEILIGFRTSKGIFRFPLTLHIPRNTPKPPVILHLANLEPLPNKYVPVEEITDAGYALAVIYYQNVVNDRLHGDYSDGMAAYFGTGQDRAPEEWGKIGMWAYSASRALDYLLTREDLDAVHTAVIGHSRLGKTALWAGAQDTRFWCTISNNSGYGGAASAKHGEGERVRDFLRGGSWDWYCENFKQFLDEKENEKPYDQSWLLAAIAPRYLCVGSAAEDDGADPKSEFLTTLWASQAWELLGHKGLVTPDRIPQPGDRLQEGCISYHLRAGRHFLSREDWNTYIRFMNEKLAEEEKEK